MSQTLEIEPTSSVNPQNSLKYAFKEGDFIEPAKEGSMTQKKGAKTPLRMRYEAEATVIRKKIGGLEEVRAQLGLSKRKMAQLLMVDPSAWTRWLKDESRTPPYVFRLLELYMALLEKEPLLHPMNRLGQLRASPEGLELERVKELINQEIQSQRGNSDDRQLLEPALYADIKEELLQLKAEKESLKALVHKKEASLGFWKLLLLVHTIGLFVYFVFY